ncbi:helix-turn-helix domain-containing protein [Microbacterium aureliae]
MRPRGRWAGRSITESAVALHGSLGPSRTSMSAVAEHAGVRRSTLYRHFPDEQALFAACSSHWSEMQVRPLTNGPPSRREGGPWSGARFSSQCVALPRHAWPGCSPMLVRKSLDP